MEDLPNNFDVIVIGTGMPECIVAAAASRIGKTVLHLERQGYYGGDWASFSFDKFLEWIDETKDLIENSSNAFSTDDTLTSFLKENERLVLCRLKSNTISNVVVKSYISETPTQPVLSSDEAVSLPAQSSTVGGSKENTENVTAQENNADGSMLVLIPGSVPAGSAVDVVKCQITCPFPEPILQERWTVQHCTYSRQCTCWLCCRCCRMSNNLPISRTYSGKMGSATCDYGEKTDVDSAEPSDAENISRSENVIHSSDNVQNALEPEWTVSQFIESRRKFNIDLSPKLMFSRGALVELLISSNVARYAEFQCVNRVLTYINNHIEQVPCSQADVFRAKNVTLVEKLMLKKFVNFCLKFEEHADENIGFEEIPFLQFLHSKGLTPNVEHYILHAIAMVDETCSTLEGIKSTQKFLQSVGRYGKSPFLCTCYGSAELPQCFCRLCAVYGGLYYLKRDVEAVILNERCCGIVSKNQRIDCQWIVMESSYCPTEFLLPNISDKISKGIFITDGSLYPGEKKENILLKFPPGPVNSNAVTILEFSSKTYVCPEDLYIVYMFCRSINATAEEDLMPVADLLFSKPGSSGELQSKEGSPVPKPNILWCTLFNQLDTSTVDLNSVAPEGLCITSSPDADLDYEHAVKQAKEIFAKMYPGEEFLPRTPDPEDILIERHNNSGEEGEEIENDVSQAKSESASNTDVENKPTEVEKHDPVDNENDQAVDNENDQTTES